MSLNQVILYFQEMWEGALEGDTQGVFFYIGIYTLLVCGYSIFFQVRTRYWPFTEGELVTAGLSRFGATTWATTDQEYVTKALYQYRVGGVSYEGQRISPWVIVASHNARAVLEKQMASIQRLSGDKVKVFYNPKRPQKSYLVIAGRFGIVCTVLIAVLPLVYYYFRFYQ